MPRLLPRFGVILLFLLFFVRGKGLRVQATTPSSPSIVAAAVLEELHRANVAANLHFDNYTTCYGADAHHFSSSVG